MDSLQEKWPGSAQEDCLRGAALGSRDAEIYDDQVQKTEDSFGSVGAGPIKTSYEVEETEEGKPPSAPVQSVEEGPGKEDGEEVTRDTGNLKLSYTTDDDVKPHRSTLQKIKEKITDKDKLKLDSGGHESKSGLLTRLKHKVWNGRGEENKTPPAHKQESHDAASDIEASSGSDTSLSTDSSASEKLFISSGTREEDIRQPRENIRQEMASPTEPASTLNEGALPSSELGTGYEEDSEGPRPQQPVDPAPAHGNPNLSEDVITKPPGEAGVDETPPALSTAVAQDRLPSEEEIPRLEEVKAPGIMDRIKEEVSAVGETVRETVGLRDDSVVRDSNKDQETGILGRFARRIGLQGSDAGHSRSHST